MAKKKAKNLRPPEPFEVAPATDKDELIVEGLRQNNLKDLSLRIPHDRITALVGPSGSGKSSVAFDTLFAEGRWRFIESLSTYTRLFLERMDRPDLDLIRNIRPSIAVEQKNPVRGSRSTVGTTTEINDYLRLLFARIGKLHCPECGRPATSWDPASAAEKLLSEYRDLKAVVGFDLKTRGRTAAELTGELLKKGFVRVRADNRVFDLSEEQLPEDLPEAVSVYADRLVIRDSDRE
ncbi:MAG TPA: excinuclease ABC subunit A, partial [Thermodesulfobacteriota bacterium]|nr:excinuclease ABC subunit A [Thermodesulfobacteriota bacterium]